MISYQRFCFWRICGRQIRYCRYQVTKSKTQVFASNDMVLVHSWYIYDDSSISIAEYLKRTVYHIKKTNSVGIVEIRSLFVGTIFSFFPHSSTSCHLFIYVYLLRNLVQWQLCKTTGINLGNTSFPSAVEMLCPRIMRLHRQLDTAISSFLIFPIHSFSRVYLFLYICYGIRFTRIYRASKNSIKM